MGRLAKAYPSLDRVSLRRELEGFERYFSNRAPFPSLFLDDQSAENFALEALQLDDSSLTWSDFGSGLTIDPVSTHEHLTQRYVTRFSSELTSQNRTDPDVFVETKRKLKQAKIFDRMSKHVVSSDIAKVEFPHSIKNGKWHCVQPLSFDLADEANIQDKAARVAGNMQGLAKEVDLHLSSLLKSIALHQSASAMFVSSLARKMFSAKLRALAKMPGFARIRLASSCSATSRT